jgi:hypothetical protein
VSNSDLPSTVTLTSNTVATVTANGVFSALHVMPLATGQVVYARGDGVDPVKEADLNHCAPPIPAEATCVPTAPASASTTAIKLISATAGAVHISVCDCEDD